MTGGNTPSPRRAVVLAVAGVMILGTMGLVSGSELVGTQNEDNVSAADTASEPFGVHLSFVDDPQTTLTVTWFTSGLADPNPVVEYGPAEDQLTNVIEASSQKTPDADTLVHEATITGLDPGETVHYRVGGDTGFTASWSASTLPEEGPYRFAHYGDQGVTPFAKSVRDGLLALEDLDLILIAGDLSYAEENPEIWDEWFEMNEALFATVPMISSNGNHEAEGPTGFDAYTARVAQPGAENYYSIDLGRIHLLVLTSDVDEAQSHGFYEEMQTFAMEDLAEADRRRTAGEIDQIWVLQHHQIYSNHESSGRQHNTDLITWEEELLQRYDVDLLIVGHNHYYERSYPTVGTVPTTFETSNYEDPLGYIQVINGGGGKSLYSFQHPDDFWPHTAAWEKTFAYVTYDVDGNTVDVTAQNMGVQGPPTLDSFTLTAPVDSVPAAASGPSATIAPTAG